MSTLQEIELKRIVNERMEDLEPSSQVFLQRYPWLRDVCTRLMAQTLRPILLLIPEGEPCLTGSKFGGLPYLPHGEHAPIDLAGEAMALLVQIRCEELPNPAAVGYPTKGLLQFWVGRDEMLGLDPIDLTASRNTRIVYYESVDETVSEADVASRYTLPPFGPAWPVGEEACQRMVFEEDFQPITSDDRRFPDLFRKAVEACTHSLSELADDEDELSAFIFDLFYYVDSKIGGWPSFWGEDPRGEERYAHADTVLLELNSLDGIDWDGDGGCLFAIGSEELSACDFSRVLYTWGSPAEEDEEDL
ncbi:MAG: hypothetical protein CSA97_02325 [Bacteroidetes bacterium]|nr:MAG: hypothetical protein CSA97_02325 [Bacteroidota bacterium]